jgi:hypothetical protein
MTGLRFAVIAAALVLLFSGCAQPELDTFYGRRDGWPGGASINGTAVLAEMFQQGGWKVISRYSLTPGISRQADCIVWFPDDVDPPSEKVRGWLEKWLAAKSGRTLVYVLRDFDAEPQYWRAIEPQAPAAQKELIRQQRKAAEQAVQENHKALALADEYPWFSFDVWDSPRPVHRLSGVRRWMQGIDRKATAIELGCQFDLPFAAEVLLKGDDNPLVASIPYADSRILAVANGSFLLNLPLVNHEHRKLAQKLIDEVGSGGTVAMLESGHHGPLIRDSDPSLDAPTGLGIFLIWPLNWILLHLSAVGILFCLARWPIFGRPQPLASEALSDFGKHITALAQLMQQSGDAAFARSRLQQWREREGGRQADTSIDAATKSPCLPVSPSPCLPSNPSSLTPDP